MMSTHSDAPPSYSEIAKELQVPAKSGISVDLPGQVDQPQLMYHQAAPQYGDGNQSVQHMPYMVRVYYMLYCR